MWDVFYQISDLELYDKYPNTSVDTVRKAHDALEDYLFQERVGLPPNPGGKDQQPEEWVQGLAAAYLAKNMAEEDREVERALKEAQEANTE